MKRLAWNKGITKVKSKPCLCGCGELVKLHKYPKKDESFTYTINKFIKGHDWRGINGFNPEIHKPRLCACGCGHYTKKFGARFNRFIKKHENIGRTAWNKGRPFSLDSKKKMSIARLGKEPANKAQIDLGVLYKLYVQEKKNTRQIGKELNISYDALKNRLQALGWSRSTKESCSSSIFKEQMRQIRIRTLISKPVLKSPNKLEKAVYDTLDKFGLSYKKQVPLFNKFVVDVLFPQNNLVLEIFGRYWHEMPVNKQKDFSKKKYLVKCGYKVEEVWDDEIKKIGTVPVPQSVLSKYNLWPE